MFQWFIQNGDHKFLRIDFDADAGHWARSWTNWTRATGFTTRQEAQSFAGEYSQPHFQIEGAAVVHRSEAIK